MNITYFCLLLLASILSSSAHYTQSWSKMAGPPLSSEWSKASRNYVLSRAKRRTSEVETMLEKGNDILGTLAYIYRVYLGPKAILRDTENCGIRNVDQTFGTDNTFYSRGASNECYWSCKWQTNPFEHRSWTFSQRDRIGQRYTYPVSSIDPTVPVDFSCLSADPSCSDGLITRIEALYQPWALNWNIILGLINPNQASLPLSLNDFCVNQFIDATTVTDVTNPGLDLFRDVINCMLYVLQSTLYIRTPFEPVFSYDHITKTMSLYLALIYSCEQNGSACTFNQNGRSSDNSDLAVQIHQVAKDFKRLGFKNRKRTKNSLDAETMEKIRNSQLNFTSSSDETNSNSQSRLVGASSDPVLINNGNPVRRYPWTCSLRSKGYRSFHKCGVTLLAVPPNPTILVSAAHCNYICKDGDRVLETCCCRPSTSETSCKQEAHCGGTPRVVEAEPEDIDIVCGEHSSEVQPTGESLEDEVVLEVKEIINHPLFSPDSLTEPDAFLDGYDISVYLVDDTVLTNSGLVRPSTIYPACLPKSDEEYENGMPGTSILAGWMDPTPTYFYKDFQFIAEWRQFHNQRQVNVEMVECLDDPAVMPTNTYYPPRTKCVRDPSQASCVEFGTSGSGLIRTFESSGHQRYSFNGPISFSRGCDKTLVIRPGFWTHRSSNPTVISDARCYMKWISAQYGMRMPDDYVVPASCSETMGTGDRTSKNNLNCNGRSEKLALPNLDPGVLTPCNWEKTKALFRTTSNECVLAGTNIYAQNIFRCIDADDNILICQNDCPGVNPNAIIIGGAAAVTAAGIAGSGVIAPVLAGAVGAGGYAMRRQTCLSSGGCIKRGRCGTIRTVRGRSRCVIGA